MNKLERLILHATGYTTLIVAVFYAFAAILKLESSSLSAGRFFLILLFGLSVSAIELFVWRLSVKPWVKNLILYLTTLSAFLLIFLVGTGLVQNGGATVLALIAVYSAVYLVALLLVYLIRRTIFKIAPKSAAEKRKSQKSKYKSLYKE